MRSFSSKDSKVRNWNDPKVPQGPFVQKVPRQIFEGLLDNLSERKVSNSNNLHNSRRPDSTRDTNNLPTQNPQNLHQHSVFQRSPQTQTSEAFGANQGSNQSFRTNQGSNQAFRANQGASNLSENLRQSLHSILTTSTKDKYFSHQSPNLSSVLKSTSIRSAAREKERAMLTDDPNPNSLEFHTDSLNDTRNDSNIDSTRFNNRASRTQPFQNKHSERLNDRASPMGVDNANRILDDLNRTHSPSSIQTTQRIGEEITSIEELADLEDMNPNEKRHLKRMMRDKINKEQYSSSMPPTFAPPAFRRKLDMDAIVNTGNTAARVSVDIFRKKVYAM